MGRIQNFRPRWGVLSLFFLTVLVYSPALGAGYLGYDDHWLIRDNTLLGEASAETLRAIFLDLRFDTRIALGAEYLPVRDLFTLLLRGVLELSPEAMHLVHLLLYLSAVFVVRAVLIALVGPGLLAELSAILFAIHPVHAESVVWLAGSKDLLALNFTAAAVHSYLRGARLGILSTFALLALFSKSTSVILPGLFLLADLALRRKIRRAELLLTTLITGAALAMHLHVGDIVGMIAPPLAENAADVFASASVIFSRYLGLSFFIHPHSIVYDVGRYGPFDPAAVGAVLLFAGLGVLAVFAARREGRIHLFALALFFLALGPVSQVLAPLQNRMADRYLLLAVLGPMLSLSAVYLSILERISRLKLPMVSLLIAVIGFLGWERASTYASTEALFLEASIRAPGSPLGPYQLGTHYESLERYQEAELAYREAFMRSEKGTSDRRKAGNNWARMLFARGAIQEARAVYETLYQEGPPSGRILYNLAKVRARDGDHEGSKAALEELRRRFPTYERDRERLPGSGPLADR